jgi:prepilin-type N-terminal cleavage/methylation domain-containing protein/prepilin-type processing-associated H-X9-DG protein
MRRGFTLIELLVVIAIIAILAAILFPVFARAREKARETSCLSNVKQINLGIQMYVQDHDGTYPLAYYNHPSLPGGGQSWAAAVNPYIRQNMEEGIWWCPSSGLKKWYGGHSAYVHYGLNAQIDYAVNPPSLHESQIEYPAMTVCIGETKYQDTNGWYQWFGFNSTNTRYSHDGRQNLGFCDGHAKNATKEQGIAAYTADGFPS